MANIISRATRAELLTKLLSSRILVLDGAMGTALQRMNLNSDDFGGAALEGCNEALLLSRPGVIADVHESYLRVGCDIIETNTFGATPLVLNEYGLGARAHEINLMAAKVARKAADTFSTPENPRFVAGSIGPTTKAISVTGGITFEELEKNFYLQAKALFEGGVDYFLLETCQDTRNVKAATLAINRLFKETNERIPIAVSGTIEPMGTLLAGQSVDAFLTSLSHLDLLYLGLNCATGPEFMTDHIRSLAALSQFHVACVPNAGLPDEQGDYLETPEILARILSRFIDNGWVNLLGGCCGTEPKHIEALVRLAHDKKPRQLPRNGGKSYLSGIDLLEITDEIRPVIVGERTNAIGSKKFKRLIEEAKFDEAAELARSQVKGGAQIIDICLANPERNELKDMRSFLEMASKKIRAPFMIDSTDHEVIEIALTYSQGKAVINSINLEDGEERFEKVIPLAKKFGAALVVGTIDDHPEQGMGITRERKLAIAERSFNLLANKYGIPAEDIYWDPLVFPCGTGDAQYRGSAVETIEAIRLLKKRFPGTKTILGISNISFGLPTAGREVLNSVFLYHCVQAGLDLAIVNAEKLERYASIPENEKNLAENLLRHGSSDNARLSDNTNTLNNTTENNDPIGAFAAHFRTKQPTAKKVTGLSALPLMERLPRYILEGSKDGLIEDLQETLKLMKPMEIINGPLMRGMDEVGKLFNANQLIVAEVLQSAEAMKAAVTFLKPFIEKNATGGVSASSRGKMLLATVKGDVHDIGKNLVEIILSNNGFEVINLGIKVPPEQLIQAAREHKPDLIGLSGLLVKSAQQMTITVEDFAKAGISTPVLVGGAALSEKYVTQTIDKSYAGGSAIYASDAMHGLELAKKIVVPESFEVLKTELAQKTAKAKLAAAELKANAALNADEAGTATKVIKKGIQPLTKDQIPSPPDFKRHVLRDTPIDSIWRYINPLMLYGRHLGLKGQIVRKLVGWNTQTGDRLQRLKELELEEPKSLEIWKAVEQVKKQYRNTLATRPLAIYQFFRAASSGNNIFLYSETTNLSGATPPNPLVSFEFPRQAEAGGLCLADLILNTELPKNDNLALFVVTVGQGIRELAEELKQSGDYLKSHIIQALALESAEAYAELLHAHIRSAWGFIDQPEMTMMERFQAKYRGKRYSFGYPACPRLEDQQILWKALNPDEIGVRLTEGFMMDPESSVSAIVFHHPEATYFSVGQAD